MACAHHMLCLLRPPTPFIKQMNRATADNSHDAALEEGLAPLQKYIRNNLNRIISKEFASPDLTFDWVDDREQDPETAATIRQGDEGGRHLH